MPLCNSGLAVRMTARAKASRRHSNGCARALHLGLWHGFMAAIFIAARSGAPAVVRRSPRSRRELTWRHIEQLLLYGAWIQERQAPHAAIAAIPHDLLCADGDNAQPFRAIRCVCRAAQFDHAKKCANPAAAAAVAAQHPRPRSP